MLTSVRRLLSGIFVLRLGLARAGKSLLTHVGGASKDLSFKYFCLAKAGQPFVDYVRRAQNFMSELLFGLVNAGQHFVDHIRRAPG